MAEKEPKKPGRGRPPKYGADQPAGGRTGKSLSIRMDPELRALLPMFIAAFKNKHDVKLDITSTVELALRKLFREWELLPKEEQSAT